MNPVFVETRDTPFNARFNNGEAAAITSMNKANDDIASQAPVTKMDIQKVGLIRKDIPVCIVSPFSKDGSEMVTVYGEVKVQTQVPAAVRGVHMSRMNSAFANASLAKYPTLTDYARAMAHAITDCHFGGPTEVTVTTMLPVFAHVKGWKAEKDKVSLDHVGLRARVVYDGKDFVVRSGLQVNHITACPCVQKTFAHAADLHDVNFPLLTHSQRSTTWVDVTNLCAPLPLPTLLDAVDSVVHRVHNTLPREYELAKVHDAHSKPQFAEDVVRDTAAKIAKVFSTLPCVTPASTVAICTVSMESIHDFDIVAEVEAPIFAH